MIVRVPNSRSLGLKTVVRGMLVWKIVNERFQQSSLALNIHDSIQQQTCPLSLPSIVPEEGPRTETLYCCWNEAKFFFSHYNTMGAQEAFSWQFGLLTAYTGTWYCLKGAEVKHLLLTTCTYYIIIAILVDIAKRAITCLKD